MGGSIRQYLILGVLGEQHCELLNGFVFDLIKGDKGHDAVDHVIEDAVDKPPGGESDVAQPVQPVLDRGHSVQHVRVKGDHKPVKDEDVDEPGVVGGGLAFALESPHADDCVLLVELALLPLLTFPNIIHSQRVDSEDLQANETETETQRQR